MEKRTEQFIGVGILLVLLFLNYSQPASVTYSLNAGKTTDFVNDGDFDMRIDYFMLRPSGGSTLIEWDEIIPAQQRVTNGGFETGDFSGWSFYGQYTDVITYEPHSGSYRAYLYGEGDGCSPPPSWIQQSIDMTDVSSISFYAINGNGASTDVDIYIDGDYYGTRQAGLVFDWRKITVDVSSYSGTHSFRISTAPSEYDIEVDDVSAYSSESVVHHVESGGSVEPVDAGMTVNGRRLYYDGAFPADGLSWSRGTANIAGRATTNFKGTMPLIAAGSTGYVRLDSDLKGVFVFDPKRLKVEYGDIADSSLPLSVYLTDVDYNVESDQPSQYRLTVYDEVGEEIYTTTSGTAATMISSPYYSENYSVGISFNDWLFGGWSNEVVLPMSLTGETLPDDGDDKDDGDDGDGDDDDGGLDDLMDDIKDGVGDIVDDVREAYEDPNDSILKMATRGWLRLPPTHDIIFTVSDAVDFNVTAWSNYDGGMFFE
jgi:hypothetical protein